MALPKRITVNVKAPFPALVEGSGPVTVTKANGVWTMSLNAMQLQQLAPPSANNATNFLIAFDQVSGEFFRISFADLKTALS